MKTSHRLNFSSFMNVIHADSASYLILSCFSELNDRYLSNLLFCETLVLLGLRHVALEELNWEEKPLDLCQVSC